MVAYRIVVSVTPFEKKKKENNRAGLPFVSRCMINTVSKHNVKIRRIERGRGEQ